MAKEKGIIYVCSTIIPDLIKIGKAESDRFKERMRFLENNGYRNCTGLKRQFRLKLMTMTKQKKMLMKYLKHTKLGIQRFLRVILKESSKLFPALTEG